MAYIKNILDADHITGAFLNSDDTGLTTNVFLIEPRLYGLKVTKQWTGASWWPVHTHTPGAPYPLTIELGEQVQWQRTPDQPIMPFASAFSKALDPRQGQDRPFDWNSGSEVRLTYQPAGSSWKASADVRYGRTSTRSSNLRKEEVGGPTVCDKYTTGGNGGVIVDTQHPGKIPVFGKVRCDPNYGPVDYVFHFSGQDFPFTIPNKYDPSHLATPINRMGVSSTRWEQHLFVDFSVGKDAGLGGLGEGHSWLSAGVRYAEFKSSLGADMNGVPDVHIPEGWSKYDADNYPDAAATFHHYSTAFQGQRKFHGVGPVLSWEASRLLLGHEETGQINADWTLSAGALFGRRKTAIVGTEGSGSFKMNYGDINWNALPPLTQTPIDIRRVDSATVPLLDLSAGLSYQVPGVKLSAGYRWERYFHAIDGGFEHRKPYDRTIDGPYVKVSVGFGG